MSGVASSRCSRLSRTRSRCLARRAATSVSRERAVTSLAHSETLGDRGGDQRRLRDGGERDEEPLHR